MFPGLIVSLKNSGRISTILNRVIKGNNDNYCFKSTGCLYNCLYTIKLDWIIHSEARGNFFYRESTIAAIEANNDMYCLEKWIENFPLSYKLPITTQNNRQYIPSIEKWRQRLETTGLVLMRQVLRSFHIRMRILMCALHNDNWVWYVSGDIKDNVSHNCCF